MTESRPLHPDHPIAQALSRAARAGGRRDAEGLDVAYSEALGLAADGWPELWPALAHDHVEHLLRLGRLKPALDRCAEYLERAQGDRDLLLLRIEILSSTGNHTAAHEQAEHAPSYPDADQARLEIAQAYWAIDQDDLDAARRHLKRAEDLFGRAAHQEGLEQAERLRYIIAVLAGDAVAADRKPDTPSEVLAHATRLRRQSRFGEALDLLRSTTTHDLEVTVRFAVAYQMVLLLRLTRQDEEAEQHLRGLRSMAAEQPDPRVAQAAVLMLASDHVPDGDLPASLAGRIQYARRLALHGDLDEAAALLSSLEPRARTDLERSAWHHAAGELLLARAAPGTPDPLLFVARVHLSQAERHAAACGSLTMRIEVLRRLGEASHRLGEDARARRSWALAHRLEETVANLQPSDRLRIRMLAGAPDEHDQLVHSTARGRGKQEAAAVVAAVVVAMEAARGATILPSILPGKAARDLPMPSDLGGAWQWLQRLSRRLRADGVVWIVHNTPEHVHHAVVGRGMLHHTATPCPRAELIQEIDSLRSCWEDQDRLSDSVAGEFEQALAAICDRLKLETVVRQFPGQITRIALVAGRDLADVPFSAMRAAADGQPLVSRFALSEQPCLSTYAPLAARAASQRGDRLLQVIPPDSGLGSGGRSRPRTRLDGQPDAQPTVAALAAHLGRHRLIRIDCHGRYDHDHPDGSWLQLMPGGQDDGRLTPDGLARLDLSRCGTLVLGACESGLGRRIGRDERTGFVRAALSAGAGSVVAAKWIAADEVGTRILDRFDRYLGFLPRDLALQRAQGDAREGRLFERHEWPEIPRPTHAAWWSCWSLYGDAGWQTSARRLRRGLRRRDDRRRNHA